jgi:hypothetical protein
MAERQALTIGRGKAAVRLALRRVDSFPPDGSYFRGLGTC